MYFHLLVAKIITSSRASAVAHGTVIGRLLSCVFQPLGLEKPSNIMEPNLAGVITSVRSTNSPNFVQIGCEMAPPHGIEI